MDDEKIYIPIKIKRINKRVEIFRFVAVFLVYNFCFYLLAVKYYLELFHIIHLFHQGQ